MSRTCCPAGVGLGPPATCRERQAVSGRRQLWLLLQWGGPGGLQPPEQAESRLVLPEECSRRVYMFYIYTAWCGGHSHMLLWST